MNKVVLILVVSCVGLGWLSLHLVKQLHEGEATIAALKAQLATLEKQQMRAAAPSTVVSPAPLIAATEPPRNAASTPAKDASKVAAVHASGASIVPPQSPPMPSYEERIRMMREHQERQRQLLQDPEYREAVRVQARSSFARQYPGVIQELGLDAQQANDFFDLLADQQMRMTEQMQPLWDVSANSDPASAQQQHRKMQQAAAELQRQNEAELAARLGQEKLQAWKEYQSTIGVRYQLEHMRSTLAARGLPLTEDLSKPMLKALAQAQQAEVNESAAALNRGAAPAMARFGSQAAFDSDNMERQIENTRKRNQRMLDAISPYLTFEQREAIEKEQQAQLKMQEAQLRIIRARGAASSNGVLEGNGQFIAVQPH